MLAAKLLVSATRQKVVLGLQLCKLDQQWTSSVGVLVKNEVGSLYNF